MALKWLFFSEKLQELPRDWGCAPRPLYLSNSAFSNCSKNVHHANGVKMAAFSEKLQDLHSGWGLPPQAPIGLNCYFAPIFTTNNFQSKVFE